MSNINHNSAIGFDQIEGKLTYPNLPEDDVYNPRIYPDKKKSNNKRLKLLLLAMMMNKTK